MMAQQQSVCISGSPSLHNPQSMSKHGVRVVELSLGEALWQDAINCRSNDVLIVSGDTDIWVHRLAHWEAGWLRNKTIVIRRGLSGEYVNINLGTCKIYVHDHDFMTLDDHDLYAEQAQAAATNRLPPGYSKHTTTVVYYGGMKEDDQAKLWFIQPLPLKEQVIELYRLTICIIPSW